MILVVPVGVGLFMAFRDADFDAVTGEVTGGVAPGGFILVGVGLLVYLAFDIWNRVVPTRPDRPEHRQEGRWHPGRRHQPWRTDRSRRGLRSLGRRTFVPGFVLGCLALIDVLWPLWDEKKQALHDKVVSSVVLRAPS